jgi:hypothetical protein
MQGLGSVRNIVVGIITRASANPASALALGPESAMSTSHEALFLNKELGGRLAAIS